MSFSNLEGQLLRTLQVGAVNLFPVIENALLAVWSMLKDFLELQEAESRMSYSVVDVIHNAFDVIRSLIHLGHAWRNSYGTLDPLYVGDKDLLKVEEEKVA